MAYARPPLPPRPPSEPQAPPTYAPRTASLRPAVPPLPPNWSSEDETRFDTENVLRDEDGRWGEPVAAPRPQRLPGGTTDAARKLEDTVVLAAPFYPSPTPDYRLPTPAPPPRQQNGAYYPPAGFHPPIPQPPPQQPYLFPASQSYPERLGPSPGPYPPRMQPSPSPHMSPAVGTGLRPRVPSATAHLTHTMHAMSLDSGAPPPRQQSQMAAEQHHRRGSASASSSGAPLVAALPSPAALHKTMPNAQTDPAVSLSWIQSVLLLASLAPSDGVPPNPPPPLPQALALLKQLAADPAALPLAYFLRGTLLSSGLHADVFPKDPRAAFKDFERAARAGYDPAWFRLGRDYEGVGDADRARECFERGVRSAERSCLYRMGMANLLGQLGLPSSPSTALPLLTRAAAVSTLEVPQPAYVLGMLLLGELPSVPSLPPALLASALPPSTPLTTHALSLIQTSAFLHFPPAQYKLGYAYENAQLGLPFDPLLSVRYYSLASQGGELEADMALSKWFLCGAEGCFDKDEGLARTFADKAARRALPSAQFAMGYYCEVGVGGRKDLAAAKAWYERAQQQGNADAAGRLRALSAAEPAPLSREQHEDLTNSTLGRRRTQVREEAGAVGARSERKGREAMEAARRASSFRTPTQGGLAAVAEDEDAPTPTQATATAASSLPKTPRPRRSPQRSPQRSAAATPPASSPAPNPNTFSSPAPSTPPTSIPVQTPHGRGYSLSEPSTAANPSSPPTSTSTPVQTPHGRGYSLSETILPTPPPQPAAPRKGPATFEEMGFVSRPVESKECVIM